MEMSGLENKEPQNNCIKNEWLEIINLNTGIGTYGVKPADGGGEEHEDEGAD